MSDALIEALRAALAAAPHNQTIRVQLGEALLGSGEPEEALLHARGVLVGTPDDATALGLAARAAQASGQEDVAAGFNRLRTALSGMDAAGSAGPTASGPDDGDSAGADVRDMDDPSSTEGASAAFYVTRAAGVTLADVGGMNDVKRELERSFLGPMRNPELRAHFGADVGGGLLLFGPPGCGKTLLARAVAGELGAQFMSLGLHDVLDMWLGQAERRLHAAFEEARRRAPCVLFFDEIDAIGQKRGQLKGHAGRNVVNQLLSEMDGLDSHADGGVFVLGATNHPWDVDGALRRPGRFDHTILVLPPDREARRAILALNLRDRPTDAVNLDALAERSDGFSGADLALVCRQAAATVMGEAIGGGAVRTIGQRDLLGALRETPPSTRSWFQLAYNFAAFANEGDQYDDLLAYIRKNKLV